MLNKPSRQPFVLLLAWFVSVALHAQNPFPPPPRLFDAPLSPRIANYDIDVRLDAHRRLLHGREVLLWKNETTRPVNELQFHLYLNAFRNNQSTFMLESRPWGAADARKPAECGFIDIERMTLLTQPYPMGSGNFSGASALSGADLSRGMRFIQPDNPEHVADRTVLSVALPREVPPGDSVFVRIDFTAQLPDPPRDRTGALEEYFMVAQWFPKIGVLQERGWNCHQFHRNSEFFSDFGVYNVWMTVPEGNLLGATGLPVGEPHPNGDGTATHFYHAEDVHDFAWTTSPEYVEFRGRAQDVDIRALVQKDHVDQGPRHIEAVSVAIEHFQNWYGDYPFPNITVVDPRRGAGTTGGVEYPTLFVAGTTYGMPESVHVLELVIIHEFGHQYWYHLLASNEFEESWMDEGINSYSEIQILHDQYGPSGDAIDLRGFKLNDQAFHRLQYFVLPDADPMLRKAWEFYSSTSYAVNSYSRPALLLTSLQNYLGREKMLEILRTYVQRWRFRHPTSADFVAVAGEVAGQNLDWFFDQAFHSNAQIDYSVDRVVTRRAGTPAGFDYDLGNPAEGGRDSLSAAGEAPETRDSLSDSAGGKPAEALYYSEVDLRRLGDFTVPVEVEVVFDNGETLREQWDGRSYWKKFRYFKPARLVSATVDPDQIWVIDSNLTNNSKAVAPASIGVNKLSVRWLFWMQFLLDQPEFLSLLSFVF